MAFRHEALLYANDAEFLAGALPFIRDGVAAGEAVLVVERAEKIDMLRSALGDDGAAVMFADMAGVGANPARIIPAWREFVDMHGGDGKGLRGIGEPIWAERTDEQLVECQRHESLLNVAFAGGRSWKLLCPYDTTRLAAAVIEEARRSHEFVSQTGDTTVSAEYRGVDASAAPFKAELAEPSRPGRPEGFDREGLLELRRKVTRFATSAGLNAARATELATAVNEVATNSLQHGGGEGRLRMWRTARDIVCEVRDAGVYRRALADRQRPGDRPVDARGLWLANQLCDLVQIRAVADGTMVRLHVDLARE